MPFLMVFLGGMLGAPVRYLVDRAVQGRHDSVFPWGTFLINVSGAFILGGIAAATAHQHLPQDVNLLLGTGFCGGLTTFSTFSFETVRLLEDGSLAEAGLNVMGSLLLGLAAAFAGFALFG
ncbi:fluoride efflux transporter CrcB [Streptacidiphilus sp. PB12-B1b]|uniref:fluoride efflux transporter CrcB n=1 Tax=Streptacidiphilus sp. PB12-B1b TaxID=2705012 RepID=UPI0015F9913C|nr:fluoride efflux transporter CrcB [Streptacidiphilus sp. PB12-B1b]QMU79720.1 fluoride efflux transporter CrcB [Streptacidiphilus sp. PB12-B1b]